MRKILICFPSYTEVEVTPALMNELLKAKMYREDYDSPYGERAFWLEEGRMTVRIVEEEQLMGSSKPKPEPEAEEVEDEQV